MRLLLVALVVSMTFVPTAFADTTMTSRYVGTPSPSCNTGVLSAVNNDMGCFNAPRGSTRLALAVDDQVFGGLTATYIVQTTNHVTVASGTFCGSTSFALPSGSYYVKVTILGNQDPTDSSCVVGAPTTGVVTATFA